MKENTLPKIAALLMASVLAVGTAACKGDSKPSPAAPTPVVNPKLTAPAVDSPADGAQLATLRPTLTVVNGTSDQTGTRTYEFQVSDNSTFATSAAGFVSSFAVVVNKTAIPEGTGKTSYALEQDLQPTTKFYWRARMLQGSTTSEWSATRMFKSKLVGYLKAGELYDPLIHEETVGQVVGHVTFIPGKGAKLEDKNSYIKYLLPQTVTSGEFSMEVEGLAANGPGDKAKVFGMQEGQDDFITNRYRVDVQYRGVNGVPPNCIQWRAMFGGDDHRIEPATSVRYASIFLLDPSRTYYWKATWDHGFRLEVSEDGPNGRVFYNEWAETSATYNPQPHYAYLGAPVGRSGAEAATIPGTIYRNVWLSTRPRPQSLGSALLPR
jgi:hypothetical protein